MQTKLSSLGLVITFVNTIVNTYLIIKFIGKNVSSSKTQCTDYVLAFATLCSATQIGLLKVAGGNSISEMKSKQQSPCSNCMHQPVTSWGNACSTCMHKLRDACISLWCHRLMHALTAWDLKFQVCLGYTFTAATLGWLLFVSRHSRWPRQVQ